MPRKTKKEKSIEKLEYTVDGVLVTTLYFDLKDFGHQVTHRDIVQYFSQFGNVRREQIINRQTHSHAFVTFHSARSATNALLSQRKPIIAEHKVRVRIADTWHQVEPLKLRSIDKQAVLPIELTNVTGTNLLDINDDCLYEILSLESLTLLDLCSIAETSTRLKEIASGIFTKHLKVFRLSHKLVQTIHTTRRALFIFGSLISELCLDYCGHRMTNIMNMVVRYCRFETLQSLTLEDSALHGIERDLLAKYESLIELIVKRLESDDYQSFIFESTFPKLETFKYEADPNYSYFSNFKPYFIPYLDFNWTGFISRHKSLKTLCISEFDCDINPLLSAICQNCKQLENLQITTFTTYNPYADVAYRVSKSTLMKLLTLHQLKKLKIRCDDLNVTKFVKKLQSLKFLEFLGLYDVSRCAELLPTLSQLKNLHVLELKYYVQYYDDSFQVNLDQLAELIKCLTNLKTLKIHRLKMDNTIYSKIVDVVRDTPGRRQYPLTIKCAVGGYVANNLEFYAENQQILEVLETVRY